MCSWLVPVVTFLEWLWGGGGGGGWRCRTENNQRHPPMPSYDWNPTPTLKGFTCSEGRGLRLGGFVCVCVWGGGGGGWKQDFVFFHFPLQALSNTTVGVVSSFAGPSEDGGRWMFPRQHWSDQIGSVANSGLQVYYVRAISANACAFCSSGGGGGGGDFD